MRSCARLWIWFSQKNGCCACPRRRGTTRREGDRRDARGGALELDRPSYRRPTPPARATAAARGRTDDSIRPRPTTTPTFFLA
jgi:hypothetical protein